MKDTTRELIQNWKAATNPLTLAEQVDQPTRRGSTTMIRCPFHEDGNPSMAVYDDGYHCFACGWHGDTVDFIMALNGWSFREFIDFIAGFQVDPRPTRPAAKQPTRDRPVLDPRLPVKLCASMGSRERRYWHRQGISEDTLAHFRVGWTGRRYAFPWYYRRTLAAVKLRRCDEATPHLQPKYISLKGSRFAAPYNIDAVLLPAEHDPDIVLIVEDEKSVMAAHEWGLVAVASPAGSFKRDWLDWLSHIGRVVIVADWDEPGLRAGRAIQGMLRRADLLVASGYTPDGKETKDLHDMHMAGIDIREWVGV